MHTYYFNCDDCDAEITSHNGAHQFCDECGSENIYLFDSEYDGHDGHDEMYDTPSLSDHPMYAYMTNGFGEGY